MESSDKKSIKSLFKEKINQYSTKNKLRENIFTKIPVCYTIDNKNNRNSSYTKKNKIRNTIKNKDLSICSNYSISNTKVDILKKVNSNKKNSKINQLRSFKQKLNEINLHNSLLVNKSLNQLPKDKKSKIELSDKFKKIKNKNKSYITKTKKEKKNKSSKNEDKSKFILVTKNKQLLEKSQTQLNNKDEKDFSFNENNNYKKEDCDINENNQINKNKNKLLYKKKKILNKQFYLKLNFINDQHNLVPNDTFQYTSNINNLDIYNFLTKSQENIIINKNQKKYNINNYTHKTINKCNSMEKKKINEKNRNSIDYSDKNMCIGIDTNHYNVKNININFNNIKVVNNISKKYSSFDNDRKREIVNNNINKDKIISLKNEEEIINKINENKEEKEEKKYSKHKIKVCKTKSSLKIPEDIKNEVKNIKVMKKRIMKGKSEHILKFKKQMRIMKIDSCTIEGKSFKQKYNQENFFMKEQFLNQKEQFLIGICNGHGKHGKLISKYIINILPKLITDTSNNNIINSYIEMNKKIINENNKNTFDCSLSGASCISLIISLDKIISINLGDNKAVLARYENGLYNFVKLNREHKPTENDEKKRILENNGKIGHLYEKENSPKKIYLKNSDIPGLSISRSFGDTIAHNVGVISEPEIKSFSYDGNEKFIILASHGFWDLIDSEESIEIVKEFYMDNMDAIGALNKLAIELLNKCENEHKAINDDITIIIVFFE